MSVRPWLSKEVEQLERLRADKISARAIGVLLRRTQASVAAYIRRNFTAAKKKPKDRILPLVQQPHTITEIAVQMNITRRSVMVYKFLMKRRGHSVFPATKAPRA